MAGVDPLEPPAADSPALRLFLAHFGVRSGPPTLALLESAAAAFSRLPYENLTKILKEAREGNPTRARRGPLEVVQDHLSLGAGGTCFSLTAAFLHLLRALGFDAEPILADRHYGPDTHCAVLVRLEGTPYLLDPGYLLARPVPLEGSGETRVETPFNEVLLRPEEGAPKGGEKLELWTCQEGAPSHRLTFRVSPADPGVFLRAWDASFGWDMMRYPLLTRVRGDAQLYLQAGRLQVRTRGSCRREEVPPGELARRIAAEFGLDPQLAARALSTLTRRGEDVGRTSSR